MITVGSKVKFTATNGHQQELGNAAYHGLNTTKEYTVNFMQTTSPYNTFLFLDGVPGHGFNMAMFVPVEVTECISQ
jgi:hypothetical protein